MPGQSEECVRVEIERPLETMRRAAQDFKQADIRGGCGMPNRAIQVNAGIGEAYYLRYAGDKAVSVLETKNDDATLSPIEAQSGRYAPKFPDARRTLHDQHVQR